MATNAAESSITVPDVGFVFDSCLRKDLDYEEATRCYSLNEHWISKDCAEQRRGRAGRLFPGVVRDYLKSLKPCKIQFFNLYSYFSIGLSIRTETIL